MLQLRTELITGQLHSFSHDGYLVLRILDEDEIAALKQDMDEAADGPDTAPASTSRASTGTTTWPSRSCSAPASRCSTRAAGRPLIGIPMRAAFFRLCLVALDCRTAPRGGISIAGYRQSLATSPAAAGSER